MALRCRSAFSSFCITLFFCHFALMLYLDGFHFLAQTNLPVWNALHRAASRAINGYFSFPPTPPVLTEASLPTLGVILTHFTESSYERDLRLPTFVSISDLARLGVKPKLSRSSWRDFASTYPLMLSPTSLKEALFAYSSSPSRNQISFTVKSTLF